MDNFRYFNEINQHLKTLGHGEDADEEAIRYLDESLSGMDSQAYWDYCSRSYRKTLEQRQKTPATTQSVYQSIQSTDFRDELRVASLTNTLMFHSPVVKLGTHGCYQYRLRPSPLSLDPLLPEDEGGKSTTEEAFPSSNLMRFSKHSKDGPVDDPLPDSDHLPVNAHNEFDIIIYPLGCLELAPQELGGDAELAYPDDGWLDTGFMVVLEIRHDGTAGVVWVVNNAHHHKYNNGGVESSHLDDQGSSTTSCVHWIEAEGDELDFSYFDDKSPPQGFFPGNNEQPTALLIANIFEELQRGRPIEIGALLRDPIKLERMVSEENWTRQSGVVMQSKELVEQSESSSVQGIPDTKAPAFNPANSAKQVLQRLRPRIAEAHVHHRELTVAGQLTPKTAPEFAGASV